MVDAAKEPWQHASVESEEPVVQCPTAAAQFQHCGKKQAIPAVEWWKDAPSALAVESIKWIVVQVFSYFF